MNATRKDLFETIRTSIGGLSPAENAALDLLLEGLESIDKLAADSEAIASRLEQIATTLEKLAAHPAVLTGKAPAPVPPKLQVGQLVRVQRNPALDGGYVLLEDIGDRWKAALVSPCIGEIAHVNDSHGLVYRVHMRCSPQVIAPFDHEEIVELLHG